MHCNNKDLGWKHWKKAINCYLQRSFMGLLVFYGMLFINTVLPAQTSNEQMASFYYQNGEFDKAELYYSALYKATPSDFYYQYLLKCYSQQGKFKESEKLIKKHTELFPSVKYLVDLGVVYQNSDRIKKAEQAYDKALKDLSPNQGEIIQLANAFLQNDKNELALEAYQKGRKLIKDRYPFNIEIAKIYATQGKYQEMISEYLGLLQINEAYIQTVQNELQTTINFDQKDEKTTLLKRELLSFVQKNPGKKIYSEMLIWLFIQQKDFTGALTYVKAIDKRFKEDGERLIALAEIAFQNTQYDVAIQAYETVIEKGESSYYYKTAQINKLQTGKTKILQSPTINKSEIETLARNYAQIIELNKTNTKYYELVRDLAEIQAYHLHNLKAAIAMLSALCTHSGVPPLELANCKMDLADYMVMDNELWEASLLYSQVDKSYKYDHLGEFAKFKRAKIWYYDGQFKRAKGELDVLKGSTSKLIANDAMLLSVLISDNTGLDTTDIPMLMFAKADLLIAQNKKDDAFNILDSIALIFPGHPLEDEVLYLKSKVYRSEKNWTAAAELLNRIISDFSYDILADNAIYNLAQIYQWHLNEKQKAMDLYQKLLIEFPGSLFVIEARKHFRDLRGDQLN